ncbi:hypothetical protein DRE_07468 [Drechslerella stenobrocha 248]|uniref:Exonuclease domain-containing protein n=1 Tax=Drechslerella stenobrocha 248 TaxID=1043628 RepID=W7HIK2_9PEZI|nr:hypothetical protein DRE_07468 [Drechslerella stenobrocha 248]
MFRPTGLFRAIGCPKIATCGLHNCLFSHQVERPPPAATGPVLTKHAQDNSNNERTATPPPTKRRKIDDDSNSKPAAGAASAVAKPSIKSILKKPSSNPINDNGAATTKPMPAGDSALDTAFDSDNGQYIQLETTDKATGIKTQSRIEKTGLGRMPSRTAAPLPVRGLKSMHTTAQQKNTLATATDPTAALKAWAAPPKPSPKLEPETLTPRSVPRSAGAWADRFNLLKRLHDELVRLDPTSQASVAGKQRLIKAARDEEEAAALKGPKAYPVTMRNRIYALTKMKPEDYRKELDEKRKAEEAARTPEDIVTGLSPEDEARAIATYVHSFPVLKMYDYVVLPPSEDEVSKAREGLLTADGVEECERCRTRFKTLERKDPETGMFTTAGKCVHHHGKAWAKDKGGPRIWSCCQQVAGETAGCTDHGSHVFVVKSPPRLATLWQFVDTPAPRLLADDSESTSSPGIEKAVCLDCEMAFTTQGLEVIRLTATRFPKYELVLDILIKPFGEMLDLNTRFSGVTQEQWDAAPPYNAREPNGGGSPSGTTLSKAASPYQAREILFKSIDASTILIGHSLENDLNCMRIIHPRVVDTAILYPRNKHLARYSLKVLVRNHLGRYIQAIDSDKGHDSKEDANEAGNLVRKRLMDDIKSGKLQKDGTRAADATFTVDDLTSKAENKVPLTEPQTPSQPVI